MNNINKGGYVPPGYYPPNAPPSEGGAPNAPPYAPQYPPPQHGGSQPQPLAYGFAPPQPHQAGGGGGYAPVPQAQPYGDVYYGGGSAPFGAGAGAGSGAPHSFEYPPGPAGPPQAYGPGPQPVIMQQPRMPGPPAMGGVAGPAGDWMSIPTGIPNCPRGLEYLTSIDQLLVKQKVELLEAFTGFETNNKFSIKNALGQKVYYAVEDTDCCTRNMCGPARPFDMKIFDNFQQEVIHVHRPLACSACCFPCCLQTMEVTAPPGNVIGSIEQEWSICSPSFRILNHIGDTVLRIEGPMCTFSMCGDVEFNVVSLTGEKVGKISKQWSGLAREIFTDADFFGLTFPMDLDVRMKAVLLGATFLIDAMFFEKSGNRETDRPGMF
ncbi:phospholipid scramblase 2 isoform X1 [Drosophila grimshawi]|uniref:Phospholipid scramblase n=1 Tax=Drosophila grimshawi TaxID=7222 RepID=B4J1M4_DROGR|nr:phospholipid scramblase 2 isoform X1 [Drosophila grimshawi]XP_043071430.1 phospholipid scramblase 2 isoform X1 [Drosophila grimshawi]EDV96944.1 GH16555 [Drosophila grimshawi]